MSALGSLYWHRRNCLAFLRRDLLFESSYRLQSLFHFVALLFFLLIFYYLAHLVGGEQGKAHLQEYGGDYFTYALVGITFMGFFNSGLVNFTTSLRQQLTMGVLEAMAAAPIRSGALLVYSLLWPMGFELVKSILYILAGGLFFGAQLTASRLPLFLAALALSLVVFGSLGVIAGSMIVYFKRGDPIAWFLSSVSLLAGGVILPVSLLPAWIQALARLLPITYALEALRGSLIEAVDPARVNRALAWLLVFAVALIPVAAWSSRVVFEKARKQGSLAHY